MSHVLQFSELEYGKGRSFDASIFHPPTYFDLTSVSYCNVHRENRMQGIAYSHSKNGNNSQKWMIFATLHFEFNFGEGQNSKKFDNLFSFSTLLKKNYAKN